MTDRAPLVTSQFVLLTVVGLGFFLHLGLIAPVLPTFVEDELGGSSAQVGLVAGSFAFSAIVLRPFVGRLGDRRGRRLLICSGAVVAASAVVFYGFVDDIPSLIGLRLVSGVGEALFFTGAASLVADLAPAERRGEALSYFSISVYTGIGLGPVLGETLRDATGYTNTFVAGGLLVASSAALALRVRDVPLEPDDDPVPRRLLHRAAILPGSILALGLAGFTAFQAFLPDYGRDELGLDGVGTAFLVYAAVVLVVRLGGARLPDRLGPARTVSIAAVLIAVGLAGIALLPSPTGLYLSTVVYAAGMSLQYPALMTMAVNGASPQERGAVVGTFTAFFDLALGAGGVGLGVVSGAFGPRAAFGVAAALALVGLVVLRLAMASTSERTMALAPSGR